MTPFCTLCNASAPDVCRSRRRDRSYDSDWERLREVLCRRCGRILPARPAAPQATFSVLARFGLTHSGRPILDVPAGHPAHFWPHAAG